MKTLMFRFVNVLRGRAINVTVQADGCGVRIEQGHSWSENLSPADARTLAQALLSIADAAEQQR